MCACSNTSVGHRQFPVFPLRSPPHWSSGDLLPKQTPGEAMHAWRSHLHSVFCGKGLRLGFHGTGGGVVGLVVLVGVASVPLIWVLLIIIGLVGLRSQLYYGNILVSWVTIISILSPSPPSVQVSMTDRRVSMNTK